MHLGYLAKPHDKVRAIVRLTCGSIASTVMSHIAEQDLQLRIIANGRAYRTALLSSMP